VKRCSWGALVCVRNVVVSLFQGLACFMVGQSSSKLRLESDMIRERYDIVSNAIPVTG
jgi:hypothetical protein